MRNFKVEHLPPQKAANTISALDKLQTRLLPFILVIPVDSIFLFSTVQILIDTLNPRI